MRTLALLPILAPLATAALTMLSGKRSWQRGVSVAGAGVHVASSLGLLALVWHQGIQVVQMGDWAAPFGITLAIDLLSAIMTSLAALTGLAIVIYSLGSIDSRRESFGYHPLLHILLMGVCGAFMTGDVFNLYVCFEIMLIASFVLLALGGERPQLEGAIKYVVINLLSSGLFLAAIGILYGASGTLNMADLAGWVASADDSGLPSALAMLFLASFSIKAGAFPFFFWLPASYHTPPVAISALFAGLLTKVGVYALIRFFTLVFPPSSGFAHDVLLVIAALTMATGVLGAASQGHIRRILSFHIISQIGYMIFGLAVFTPLALAGAVFYLIHHIIVKANLFLIGGIVNRLQGSDELQRLGGLYASHPGLSLLFLIPALSLAGIPPLSGFWAKFALVRAGLDEELFVTVAVALAVGLMTVFSMTKIWSEVFWKPRDGEDAGSEGTPPASEVSALRRMAAPAVTLALLTLIIGLAAEPFFDLARRTADQLLDPGQYIHAVLGEVADAAD